MKFRRLGIEITRIPKDELKGREPSLARVDDPVAASQQRQEEAKKAGGQVPHLKKSPSVYVNSVTVSIDGYQRLFDYYANPEDVENCPFSQDFLNKVSRGYNLTKKGEITVRVALPKKLRKPEKEEIIRRRLDEEFKEAAKVLERKMILTRVIGTIVGLAGLVIMYFYGGFPRRFHEIMVGLGYFALFTGGDIVKDTLKRNEAEDICRKMAKARFEFVSDEIQESVEKAKTAATKGKPPEKKEEKPKEKKSAEPAAPGVAAAEATTSAGPASAGTGGEASG